MGDFAGATVSSLSMGSLAALAFSVAWGFWISGAAVADFFLGVSAVGLTGLAGVAWSSGSVDSDIDSSSFFVSSFFVSSFFVSSFFVSSFFVSSFFVSVDEAGLSASASDDGDVAVAPGESASFLGLVESCLAAPEVVDSDEDTPPDFEPASVSAVAAPAVASNAAETPAVTIPVPTHTDNCCMQTPDVIVEFLPGRS